MCQALFEELSMCRLFSLLQNPKSRVYYYPHLVYEGTEIQRCQTIYQNPYSNQQQSWNPGSLVPELRIAISRWMFCPHSEHLSEEEKRGLWLTLLLTPKPFSLPSSPRALISSTPWKRRVLQRTSTPTAGGDSWLV